MKAIILAGGLGTRLSEETHSKPKPMVEIGGMPILWHIMKIFDFYGINEFIICCGYKGFYIKDYFNNYHLRNTDVTFDLTSNSSSIIRKNIRIFADKPSLYKTKIKELYTNAVPVSF